jgi:hypothetical protein
MEIQLLVLITVGVILAMGFVSWWFDDWRD